MGRLDDTIADDISVVESAYGVSVSSLPATAGESDGSLDALTVMSPASLVRMVSTYRDAEPAEASQPQLLAPGALAPVAYVSETTARHCDAARITSEIFALTT